MAMKSRILRKLFRSRAWGGVSYRFALHRATLTLLIAVSKNQISVLQGIVQAVGHGQPAWVS